MVKNINGKLFMPASFFVRNKGISRYKLFNFAKEGQIETIKTGKNKQAARLFSFNDYQALMRKLSQGGTEKGGK